MNTQQPIVAVHDVVSFGDVRALPGASLTTDGQGALDRGGSVSGQVLPAIAWCLGTLVTTPLAVPIDRRSDT